MVGIQLEIDPGNGYFTILETVSFRSVVGSALQMETQLEVKGKNDKELYELEL